MTPFLIGTGLFLTGLVLGTYFGFEAGRASRDKAQEMLVRIYDIATKREEYDRLVLMREQTLDSRQDFIDVEFLPIVGPKQ